MTTVVIYDQTSFIARANDSGGLALLQLNGLFWIKRLSRLKRERLAKRFEKVSRS